MAQTGAVTSSAPSMLVCRPTEALGSAGGGQALSLRGSLLNCHPAPSLTDAPPRGTLPGFHFLIHLWFSSVADGLVMFSNESLLHPLVLKIPLVQLVSLCVCMRARVCDSQSDLV